MHERLFSEDFKTDPYWWEDAPCADLGTPALPARADVVVIGSGYTGLNAALVTARAGRETLVLDTHAPGSGCSTRNGGQISTSVKPTLAALTRRHGRERAFAIRGEGHAALEWIETFVKSENIACDFRVPGRFHAAHSAASYERLARSLAAPDADPRVEAHLVPRAEQHAELGTDAYFGGVVFPRHASLHPARYHQGLLQRAQAAGVRVVPHCEVTAIGRHGDGMRLTTTRGEVASRDVVVASNGYTGRATPWQRRRVIPIGSYVIATEALPATLMDRLMPRDRIVSDTRRVVYYYRPSPDRTRIVFGGRVSFGETDPRVSGPRLHRDLVAIFPQLADTRISHTWVGFVAYTFDELAHVGRHEGIHYAMGYCGSGVSMASYLGMRVGQQVLGLAEGRTAFDGLGFQTRPLYHGKPWFLAPSVMFFRWLDRLGP